ncbi:hypothetical protein GQ600_21430 [Phytophthora cactorum]|nr:hypothetical protein GQ600_21430 [Phytophthora cactorum]
MCVSTLGVDRLSMEETSATSSSCKVGVSAPGADTAVICSKITEGFAARRRGNKGVSAPGVDTNSATGRRGVKSASTPGKLACSRAAGLHEEAICNQAGLDCLRPRKESAGGYDNGNPGVSQQAERGGTTTILFSSSGGDVWAAGGAPERTNHRYHHQQQMQQQMVDEESTGPRRNDAANLERAEPVSSSGQR